MVRSSTLFLFALQWILLGWTGGLSGAGAQDLYARQRATLQAYVGQDVLIIDTTSGSSQFQNPDALITYRLKLDAVQNDYIIVSRNVEGDKRDFVYPLATIRRIRTESDGRPLRPIVIELY